LLYPQFGNRINTIHLINEVYPKIEKNSSHPLVNVGLTAKKNNQINKIIKARILTISVFFNVFFTIDLNVFGANNIGNQITSIKNAVQSKSNVGNATIRDSIRK